MIVDRAGGQRPAHRRVVLDKGEGFSRSLDIGLRKRRAVMDAGGGSQIAQRCCGGVDYPGRPGLPAARHPDHGLGVGSRAAEQCDLFQHPDPQSAVRCRQRRDQAPDA